MLALSLLIINLVVTGLGIYFFDYQVDQIINNPLVIIGSIFGGFISGIIGLLLYNEIAYYLFAKKQPVTSMFLHHMGKQIMSVPFRLLNMRVKVIGKDNLPKDPSFLIYSNHMSEMDIPIIMYNLYDYPIAFLSKESVGRYFSIGKWSRKIGCVFLDRSSDRKGAEAIINVIKKARSGLSMVVFPEGTVDNRIAELLPFKDGAFKAALKGKVPLVPISIVKKYKHVIWPFVRRLELVVHKPLPFEAIKELKSQELSEKVRKIITSVL